MNPDDNKADNPKKAGLVKDISEYKWSSYNDYINDEGVTDTDFALKIMSNDKMNALEEFIKFHAAQNEDKCLEIEERIRLTDDEAEKIIKKICRIKNTLEIKNLEKEKRKTIINLLKSKGISARQLERLTVMSRVFIMKS